MEKLCFLVIRGIAKWASSRSKFDSCIVDAILHNWDGSLICCSPKVRKVLKSSPPEGVLTFKVDGVVRGKPGLAALGGVLHNREGAAFGFFL